MPDQALPPGELSKARLDELFDNEVKFQLERRTRFAEEFAQIAAVAKPIARAAGQAELLIASRPRSWTSSKIASPSWAIWS